MNFHVIFYCMLRVGRRVYVLMTGSSAAGSRRRNDICNRVNIYIYSGARHGTVVVVVISPIATY